MKRRTARSSGLAWLLVAMCALGIALVAAPTASAAAPTLVGTFDGRDTPDGSLGIQRSTHVAVDESTGNVWVNDPTHDVVDQFDANGNYTGLQITTARLTRGTSTTFSFGSKNDDIAVDNSGGPGQGDVYVFSLNASTLFAFDSSGSERWEVGSTDASWCGVGIDPSGHPWMSDFGVTALIQLDPSNGAATGTSIPTSTTNCHLGFDGTGAVYASAGNNQGLNKYDLSGNALFSIDPNSIIQSVGTSFGQPSFFTAGVDAASGDPSIRQWDLNGNSISRIDGTVSNDRYQGIAFNGRTRLLYVSDAVAQNIQIYSVPAQPPGVISGRPTNITATSGTVNGSVNANGSDVTDCHVDYVTDAQFSSSGFTGAPSVPCTPASPLVGADDVAITADLTGLTPSTTYHTEIVATNAGGTTTGSDILLTTLAPPPVAPVVVTGSAAGISETGATLAGTVNPNEFNVTDCHIDYGTSTSYGSSVPCSSSPGSGSSAVSVSGAVTGLSAGTTYHFRVVAVNAGGTTNGDDATFATTVRPPPTCDTDPSMPQCHCPGDLTKCHPHLHLNGGGSWVGSNWFLRVKCSDDLGGTCAGNLTLKAVIKVKVKKGHKTVVKKKTITVGTASYSLAVGGTARLKVKLTSAAKSALKKGGLTATVTSSTDGKLGSVKIAKLKVRRAKHKRK